LEAISAATGWQSYGEHDAGYAVAARFEGLAPPDALRRLLGDLNFALLPQTNGPAKLFVYRKSLDHATQLVQVGKGSAKRSRPSKIIGKELILTLKRGSKTDVAALSTRLHGRVVGRLDAFNAFRLEFDDDTAAREARAALERERGHDGLRRRSRPVRGAQPACEHHQSEPRGQQRQLARERPDRGCPKSWRPVRRRSRQ